MSNIIEHASRITKYSSPCWTSEGQSCCTCVLFRWILGSKYITVIRGHRSHGPRPRAFLFMQTLASAYLQSADAVYMKCSISYITLQASVDTRTSLWWRKSLLSSTVSFHTNELPRGNCCLIITSNKLNTQQSALLRHFSISVVLYCPFLFFFS